MTTETKQQDVVESIGTTGNGVAVIRIRVARGALIEVSTNVVGFAKLAAAGVRVVNEYANARRR